MSRSYDMRTHVHARTIGALHKNGAGVEEAFVRFCLNGVLDLLLVTKTVAAWPGRYVC